MTTPSEQEPRISLPRTTAALLAITLCGLLLRLYELGKESIWVDEGFTYRLSKLTLPQYIANVLRTIRNVLPPLYFQLMHYWTALFGTSELSLRLPSVIFGTLSMLGIYAFARKVFDKEAGVICALLLALSVFHIQYSQEARMYELLSLLSIASFCLLVKFIRDNRWSSALLLGIANISLMYTHHYGFFIVFSEYVFAALIFLTRRDYRRNGVKRWLALSFMSLLAVAPWLFGFINQAQKVAKDPWLPAPTLGSILSLFLTYSGGPIFLGVYVSLIGLWLISKVFSLPRIFKKEETLDYSWYLLLVSWLAVPILAAFTYSKVVGPIFGTKYLIASSIPFFCLVSRAISSLTWKYARYGLLVVIVVVSSMNAWRYYHAIHKEQWREAAQFVEKLAQPNDLVIINAGFGLENGFDYYSKREDIVKKPFPERTVEVNTRVTPNDFPELLETVSGHDRVWVVFSHGHDEDGLIRGKLLESYSEPYGRKEFVNVRVCLFEKARR